MYFTEVRQLYGDGRARDALCLLLVSRGLEGEGRVNCCFATCSYFFFFFFPSRKAKKRKDKKKKKKIDAGGYPPIYVISRGK